MEEIEDDYDAVPDNFAGGQSLETDLNEDGELIFQNPEPQPVYLPCDTKSTLYAFKTDALDDVNDYIKVPNSRPFYVKKIPHSNLLLIVINVLMPSKGTRLTTEPQPIEYDTEFPCYKLNMSFYERRRIEECYSDHPDVITTNTTTTNLYINPFQLQLLIIHGFLLIY